MTRPALWTLSELLGADLGNVVVWVSPSVRTVVEATLPYPIATPLSQPPAGLDTLVVVGGGKLIDAAKAWVHDHAPAIKLVAVPSLWGSGAEASPVVVLHRSGRKEIRCDSAFVPYARVEWPALANSIPPQRAREACGDCWAHALEGFLSPLATDALRAELADLLTRMLAVPLANDTRWFALSAEACAGQARSSVGLVHGIAHTLEGPLCDVQPDLGWGHAKLCAVFLRPVMRLNRHVSGKWDELMQRYELAADSVLNVLNTLFDVAAYDRALPLLRSHWPTVLRDPCTRTNCALVRASHLSFFEGLPSA